MLSVTEFGLNPNILCVLNVWAHLPLPSKRQKSMICVFISMYECCIYASLLCSFPNKVRTAGNVILLVPSRALSCPFLTVCVVKYFQVTQVATGIYWMDWNFWATILRISQSQSKMQVSADRNAPIFTSASTSHSVGRRQKWGTCSKIFPFVIGQIRTAIYFLDQHQLSL